jgi:hypothetical protein
VSIDREIEDLKPFSIALRQENRALFEKMISEIDPETLEKASIAKDPFEVILMGLIFNQQKLIKRLLEQMRDN